MTTVHQIAPGHWAGHMRIYHRACLTLADAGYDIEFSAHPMKKQPLDKRINLYSLGDYGTPTLAWRLSSRLKRCWQAYNIARASRAAIFQYYAPEFIPWGARLRQTSGRPVIFDCMEDFEGYARQRRGIPTLLRPPLARIVQAQLKLAARSCDAIVVADEGTAATFRPYARRVVVLHNFPRLALFPKPSRIPENKQYDLVYHGSIPKYHLEACLLIDEQLVKRGHQLRWRFIGSMAEKPWFLTELARRGISERFSIEGLIPHNEIASEVRKAKIGIIPLPNLPKFQHNIPTKLFEFMALEMPVVLSDLPPSRPFVGDGGCAIMVPHNDYGAYANAIIRLVKDMVLCQQMGAEGRKRVETEYNWEREASKLIDLYEELLDQKHSVGYSA